MVNEQAEALKEAVEKQADAVTDYYEDLRPPRLPVELISRIVSFLPNSKIKEGRGFSLVIRDWFPHMCVNPSLPLGLQIELCKNEPGHLARQLHAIMELRNVNFDISIDTRDIRRHAQNLRLLLQYPQRWTYLRLDIYDENVDYIQSILHDVAECFPYLIEFALFVCDDAQKTQMNWNSILSMNGNTPTGHPEFVGLDWPILPSFVNIGLYHSIRRLWLLIDQDMDHFSECLPLLSKLPCLEELVVRIWDENIPRRNLAPVQPVHIKRLVLTGNNESQVASCVKLFKGSSIPNVYLKIFSDASAELLDALNDSLPNVEQVVLAPNDWVRNIPLCLCFIFTDVSFVREM